MNIQNILWPKIGICTEEEMYFRKKGNVNYIKEGELHIKKGGIIQFDTYFNGLSIDKWKKYTNIGPVSLNLNISGSAKVQLLFKEKIHNEIFTKILKEELIDSNETKKVNISFPDNIKGMIYFRIYSLSDETIMRGGYYSTEVNDDVLHYVKLGVVICTYKRESFIENNIKILNKIFNNNNSPLNDHMEIFISDNGESLDVNRLQSTKIHINGNKNTGGAGGFTRGLIEILNSNPDAGITHALLMDDDIIIEPESLMKTYNLLSLIKEEYIDTFIGGAMLRMDKQNVQVESGASWNAGKLRSLKSELDMRLSNNCIFNEIEEYREFNAWWYCCFPISLVSYDNLPMPIFIRGDDVEYGLRNMKHLILMNGICVWHEPFENKYSSFLYYYILRNQLIDNALHFPNYGKKQALRDLRSRVFRELMYYRYKNVELLLMGVRDFLKGIDWLIETDGESLHKKIMGLGYKTQPVEELDMQFYYSIYENSLHEKDNSLKRIIRLLLGNGILLPARRDNIVSMAKVRPYNTYLAKRVLYFDVTTNKGFICMKNYKKLYQCLRELQKTESLLRQKFDHIKNEYKNRSKEVQNVKFWQGYLDMK